MLYSVLVPHRRHTLFLQRFGASEAVAECAGLGVQGTEGSEVQGFPLAPIFVHCFFRVVRFRLVSSSFRAVFAPHFLMRSAKLWERRVLAGIRLRSTLHV